jgi:hypothetical protein
VSRLVNSRNRRPQRWLEQDVSMTQTLMLRALHVRLYEPYYRELDAWKSVISWIEGLELLKNTKLQQDVSMRQTLFMRAVHVWLVILCTSPTTEDWTLGNQSSVGIEGLKMQKKKKKKKRQRDVSMTQTLMMRADHFLCAVGGNHEACNHLWELYYGGWVAPNIYYMGHAGVVNFGGLRIGGISGIYNSKHYKLVRSHPFLPTPQVHELSLLGSDLMRAFSVAASSLSPLGTPTRPQNISRSICGGMLGGLCNYKVFNCKEKEERGIAKWTSMQVLSRIYVKEVCR